MQTRRIGQAEKVVCEYVTVARDDEVYECFPDMTRLPSGDLMVIYRESEAHEGYEYCNLIVRRSADEGLTWGERQVIVEGPRGEQADPYVKYNCPKISTLTDGRVAAVCDENVFEMPREQQGRREFLIWWSDDDGASWSQPQRTGIHLGLPDKVYELSDATLLLGGQVRSERSGKLTWRSCRSQDAGRTWSAPITIADDGRFEHCEGSVVELPGGELVCYMRENSHQGYPGYKCLSRDRGLTWEGPYRTLMAGCERPIAGMLDNGKVLVTYRSNMRGAAGGKQNQFAYLESVESALEPDRARQEGRIIMLDHDTNPRPDTGYSGWAQLRDGRVLCAYYIKRDAPMAFIRGRFFSEADF